MGRLGRAGRNGRGTRRRRPTVAHQALWLGRLQVFVSSTLDELAELVEERRAVSALRLIPVMFEVAPGRIGRPRR
jgi:hypothetical protein